VRASQQQQQTGPMTLRPANRMVPRKSGAERLSLDHD
jgi:hypothetical protein